MPVDGAARFEVENKFPVEDFTAVEARLLALGARIGTGIDQVDTYLSHPARDFAVTDEALRIRRVGEANVVTYKGPRIDSTTKTRREIELPLEPGDGGAARWLALFQALGFHIVAEVRKRRRPVEIPWEGTSVAGAFDEVDKLGAFVELEIIVSEAEVELARTRLAALARALRLGTPERRSYLELVMEMQARGASQGRPARESPGALGGG